MDLNILWFFLIATLFSGFFFLEGFDFGVGMLTITGKSDHDRRLILNSVGHVWDGNEVWLLTAGGAMFAAFPGWYATMFSGFYIALTLVLLSLIVRGVTFEFRSKYASSKWRGLWDKIIAVSNLLPPLLIWVAVANLAQGTPIDAHQNYVGTFFNLLSPYTLSVGLLGLFYSLYNGALYLTLKLDDPIKSDMKKKARLFGALLLVFGIVAAVYHIFVFKMGMIPLLILLVALVCEILAVGLTWLNKSTKLSFFLNMFGVVFLVFSVFAMLFPNVMVSSLDAAYNLTIYNVASGPYTLKVMSIVAVILIPIVLLYTGWTYWVFRGRLKTEDINH